MSAKEYREMQARMERMGGKERYKEVEKLQVQHYHRLGDQIGKMERERRDIGNMSPEEYEKVYLKPPEKAVKVAEYTDPKRAEAVVSEAAEGEKVVFVDLRSDVDGRTALVAVDEKGDAVDTLLTFAPDGVVDRKASIKPEVGLALGKDGSLRGRIAVR